MESKSIALPTELTRYIRSTKFGGDTEASNPAAVRIASAVTTPTAVPIPVLLMMSGAGSEEDSTLHVVSHYHATCDGSLP